ncbi:MAG TPA: hypothetical protein VK826_05985 [Bacteroidia bacterium]|nr:hypothetical protein [Bacteroidia bacterium]
MRPFRTILPSFLLCVFAAPLCAQEYDEDMLQFEPQIKRIILSAKRVPGSTIVLRLHTFKSSSDKGSKERVVIRFLNDSVFEQKSLLSKTQHVIRKNAILDYDPEAGKGKAYEPLVPVDSAGYSVLAFKLNPDDTVYSSYCRIRYDSLHRMCDYYFVFSGGKPVRETWTYEGDSTVIHTRYEIVQDTFHLKYEEHMVRYVNSDSTYFLRTWNRRTWRDSAYVRNPGESHTTRLEYDAKGRIIRVEISERSYRFLPRYASEVYHTMEVEYREK